MLIGSPVVRGILSTIWPFASSKTMMESGYAPRNSVAAEARAGRLVRNASTASIFFIDSFVPRNAISRKNDIESAPIFRSCGTLSCPIGSVIQMIRHLCRPETGDVAIVDVALHGLAEPRRTSRGIHLPARRKRKSASHRNVRPGCGLLVLQRHHIIFFFFRELTGN